jgi:hypothetical protein
METAFSTIEQNPVQRLAGIDGREQRVVCTSVSQ